MNAQVGYEPMVKNTNNRGQYNPQTYKPLRMALQLSSAAMY
jgi:hypothetical protein